MNKIIPAEYKVLIELFAKFIRQSVLAISIVLSTSWCAFAQVSFNPAYPFPFEGRNETAKNTELDDAALEDRGYIKIGQIVVETRMKACFEGERCWSTKAGSPTTEKLYEAAAARGADLVQNLPDEEMLPKHFSMQGECARYEFETEEYLGDEPYYHCGSVNAGCQATTKLVWKTRPVKKCAEYKVMYGVEYFNVRSGVLWRHEPNFYESEKYRLLNVQDEQRRARHILIQFGDDEDAARSQAEDLLMRIRSGESFEALAAEFSMDGGTASQGGDLGVRTESQWPEALGAAIFAMQEGDLEGPVRSDFGFHIIRLDDILEAGSQPLDQDR